MRQRARAFRGHELRFPPVKLSEKCDSCGQPAEYFFRAAPSAKVQYGCLAHAGAGWRPIKALEEEQRAKAAAEAIIAERFGLAGHKPNK
jgi:hypothetical protein